MAKTATDAGFGNKQLNALPSAPIREQNYDINAEMFGGGNANTFKDLARGTGEAANNFFKVQQERDILEATELDTQYQSEIRGALYDANNGYLSRQGGNAIGVTKEAEKRLDELRRAHLDKASGQGARDLFYKSSARTVESTLGALQRYELSQQQKWRDDTIDARILNNANKVAVTYNDDSEFQKTIADNNSAVAAKAAAIGASPEMLVALQRTENSKLYASRAASMIENPDPDTSLKGAEFLEKEWLNGNVSDDHYKRLNGVALEAKKKGYSLKAFNELISSNVSAPSDEQTIQMVLKNEGGYVPIDGASGHPAIYGINAKWHPKEFAEAKRLTDTEGAAAGRKYAGEFYKREYFDKKNLSALPENVRHIVMDGVVNHWSGFSDKLIEAAKTKTPQELVKMRLDEYERLARENPEKYAKSLPGWKNRLMNIAAPQASNPYQQIDVNSAAMKAQEIDAIVAGGGETLLSMVDKRNKMIKEQETAYADSLAQQAAALMAQSNGDVSVIPANLRNELVRTGQWEKATKYDGTTDTSVLLKLRALPDEKFASVNLSEYSLSLSRNDLLHEQERQKKLASGDEGFKAFSNTADNYWLQTTGNNKQTPEKAKFSIRAEKKFQRFVDENKRAPNAEEIRSMVQPLLLESSSGDKVYQNQEALDVDVGGVPLEQAQHIVSTLDRFDFDGTVENIESFAKNPSFFIGPVSGVPVDSVNGIALQLITNKVAVTPANIQAIYNRAKENGETIPTSPAIVTRPSITSLSTLGYDATKAILGFNSDALSP